MYASLTGACENIPCRCLNVVLVSYVIYKNFRTTYHHTIHMHWISFENNLESFRNCFHANESRLGVVALLVQDPQVKIKIHELSRVNDYYVLIAQIHYKSYQILTIVSYAYSSSLQWVQLPVSFFHCPQGSSNKERLNELEKLSN